MLASLYLKWFVVRVVHPPMLAVGSDEPNTTNAAATVQGDKTTACNGKVFIYE